MAKAYRYIVILLIACVLFGTLYTPMTVHAEENINHESDDNNTVSKADTLEQGIITVGRLDTKKDVDCFRIEVDYTCDILFHFTHEADGVYAYYWYAEITDQKGNVLNKGNLSGKEPSDFSAQAVQPGVYYLKISPASGGNPMLVGYTNAAYRITLATKCLTHGALTDWQATKPATCLEDGERAKLCTVCNSAVVVETVKALGHDFTQWNIIEEADFFTKGEREHTCVRCGQLETERFTAPYVPFVIWGGLGAIIAAVVIKGMIDDREYKKNTSYTSRTSYSGGSSYSGSSSYSGGNSGAGNSSGGYHTDYPTSSGDDDYIYTRPADGTINIDGDIHNVYTSDAEGYSTGPYIEDAEGYKTAVDPADVNPPFNWLDC